MRTLVVLIFLLLPFEESDNFIAQFGTPISVIGLGLIPFIFIHWYYMYRIRGYLLTIFGIYILWVLNNIDNPKFIITVSGNILLMLGAFVYVRKDRENAFLSFTWLSYWYILVSFLNAFDLIYTHEVHDDRLFFFNMNPNDYSLILLFAFLFLRNNISKYIFRLLLYLITAWLIFQTKSRFALGVLAITLLLDYRRYILVVFSGLFLIYLNLNMDNILESIRLSDRENVESFGGRTELWNMFITLEIYKSIFGESVAAISQKMTLVYDRNRRFHNSFLDIYASTGFIGFLLWLKLWSGLVWESLKDYYDRRYGSILLPLVVVILGVSLKSGSLYGFKFLWISIGIIIGILTGGKKESVYSS